MSGVGQGAIPSAHPLHHYHHHHLGQHPHPGTVRPTCTHVCAHLHMQPALSACARGLMAYVLVRGSHIWRCLIRNVTQLNRPTKVCMSCTCVIVKHEPTKLKAKSTCHACIARHAHPARIAQCWHRLCLHACMAIAAHLVHVVGPQQRGHDVDAPAPQGHPPQVEALQIRQVHDVGLRRACRGLWLCHSMGWAKAPEGYLVRPANHVGLRQCMPTQRPCGRALWPAGLPQGAPAARPLPPPHVNSRR